MSTILEELHKLKATKSDSRTIDTKKLQEKTDDAMLDGNKDFHFTRVSTMRPFGRKRQRA